MFTALYVIASLLIIFLMVMLLAPKKYLVERSITINRTPPEVYEYLRFLKNQDHWSPWKKRDPGMKQEYRGGNDGDVGFVTSWDSDHKQVGSGEQEILSLKPNERIETDIRFLKPWKSRSTGFFTLEKDDAGGTKTTWGFYGSHSVPLNVMMLMYNMDKAVGKDFEEGLLSLKEILEQ